MSSPGRRRAPWGSLAIFMAGALGVQAIEARGAVQGAWVTTDRSVDCSSYETIVRDVLKPGMSEEQKAIALFYFYRHMVYHYQNLPESRDPIKCINVIGNTLCGSQGTCMKGLLGAAGIKARVVSIPGHTFYEAFYDHQWHGFDTMNNFYVFTRGEKPHVASFEELRNDHSLISEAVKENRACPNMCPCGDNPMDYADKLSINNYDPEKLAWSVKDLGLRPGEELVRSWWPQGKPLPGTTNAKDAAPHHTCGGRDRDAEPDNFKFWEPYGVPKFGRVSMSYRHYFNGCLNYAPNLTNTEYKDGLLAESGVKPSPEGLAGEGELVIPVKCPFYISAAVVRFEATCAGEGDSVTLSASVDGKTWTPVESAQEAGTKSYRGVLDKLVVRRTTGLHAYRFKFALKGKAVLNHFYARTIFTHNAMALPQLMPGKNKITLSVSNPEALKASSLTLVYRYKEAPPKGSDPKKPVWGSEVKSIEQKAESVPFSFEVELPETDKLPQMQDLTLRCGSLAWAPPASQAQDKVVCDFSAPDSVKLWKADEGLNLSHDGTGLLLEVPKKAQYPQAKADVAKEDWSKFQTLVVEVENVGLDKQNLTVRVASNEDTKQRSDSDQLLGKGKASMRIPLSSMTKTQLNAVTKLYFMLTDVPDAGCKIRVTKVVLEPNREF